MVGGGNWSLGEKYGPKDLWTNNLPLEVWGTQLLEGDYNYVFLARADDNFWNHYAGLFDNPAEAKSHRLFRVQPKNNQVRLVIK